MLRPYFQRHRCLLKQLCALAHESLAEYLRAACECPKGVPGIILTPHTFGEYLAFHPHVHALMADGLFLRRCAAPTAPITTRHHQRAKPQVPGGCSPSAPTRGSVLGWETTLNIFRAGSHR
jgi:hypothetical protein